MIPLSFHSAISLLGSILIFPSTISAQFTSRLQTHLTPLILSIEQHRQLLGSSVASNEFMTLASSIKSLNSASEGNLIGLAVSERLLQSDIIWARFAPCDFSSFHSLGRKLSARADGLTRYFSLANPGIDTFPSTPIPSGYNTPAPATPHLSRAPSIERTEGRPKIHIEIRSREADTHQVNSTAYEENSPAQEATSSRSVRAMGSPNASSRALDGTVVPSQPPTPTTPSHRHHSHSHHHRHHSHSHPHHGHHLHNALLHLSLGGKREEGVVGVFESQRYMNLEARRHDPYAQHYSQQLTVLLGEW
jgi:hypothetical protein